MKHKFLLNASLLGIFLNAIVFCRIYADPSTGKHSPLTLTPVFSGTTLDYGYGKIPFSVKNNSNQNLLVVDKWDHVVDLMTSDDSGQNIPIENYRRGPDLLGNGRGLPGKTAVRILKPGETGTFDSLFSMETLDYVAKKGKKIFGGVTGFVAGTNRQFQYYSDAFAVPANLTKPPWVDLGTRSYFSVVPDPVKIEFYNGDLLIPVTITNTTSQPFLADLESVRFFLVRNGPGADKPSPWHTMKDANTILQPGGSVQPWERPHINLAYVESEGYEQGDRVIAGVGGRVPNTNEVFECYSAPFEFPPFPKPSSKK